jgi:putative FmdB family regulatory protein
VQAPEVGVPLFEYECRKCRNQFEALVIGTRKPACPRCKSEDLEKRASAFGLAGVGGGSSARRSGGCAPSGGG